MSDIASKNLEFALSRHTRSVLQSNWQVGTGATTTVIPVTLRNPSGVAVDVTGQVASDMDGGTVEFVSGANLGSQRNVIACAANGQLTLDTALTTAPSQGDQFVIIRAVRLQVTAPENVTQVGGQPVPSPGGVAYLPTTNSPQSILAVASGAIAANGALLSAVYAVPANGSIVIGVTLAAGAASSVLQVSRDASAGTPFYGQLNSGSALAALIEFNANIPVAKNDVVQFEFVTATTLGWAEFAFVPNQ